MKVKDFLWRANLALKTGWSREIVQAITSKEEGDFYRKTGLYEDRVTGRPVLKNPLVDSKTAKQIFMGDKFLNRNEMEINDFLENQMVMFRSTKSEIAMKVAEFFDKQPDAVCETDEEDKECDYHMSVSFSEETSNDTKWCDIDLYYLKMRKKERRYVTEVSFELY